MLPPHCCASTDSGVTGMQTYYCHGDATNIGQWFPNCLKTPEGGYFQPPLPQNQQRMGKNGNSIHAVSPDVAMMLLFAHVKPTHGDDWQAEKLEE